MTKVVPIKLITAPYVAFLFDKINKIYEAWDRGDTELALTRAQRLCLFLPKKLKERIQEDYEKVNEEMEAVYELTRTSDFFNEQLTYNKQKKEKAAELLKPFIDKLIDIIDDAGLIEHHAREIPTNVSQQFFEQ